MKFIQGKPRNQWELHCLGAYVDADNEVRLIDLFVDSLNLTKLGFKTQYEENGRPAYHPGALICSHSTPDVGMIFTAYNLRRIINILDKNLLKAYLKALGAHFWSFQRHFKAVLGPVFCVDLDYRVC